MKRFTKLKGMYEQLLAVATMIGITIYASCSADEDFGYYYSGYELNTRADGMMGSGNEGNSIIYPTANDILNNSGFIEIATGLWNKTLSHATSEVRYEFGSYVKWDKSNNSYSWVAVKQGEPAHGYETCSIQYGKYNKNNPAHIDYCATFHTHPPLTTVPVSDTVHFRTTGPSENDRNNAIARGLPSLVCDYSGNRIYSITPKDAMYQIYLCGPDSRQ
jgi:hypothetical protein